MKRITWEERCEMADLPDVASMAPEAVVTVSLRQIGLMCLLPRTALLRVMAGDVQPVGPGPNDYRAGDLSGLVLVCQRKVLEMLASSFDEKESEAYKELAKSERDEVLRASLENWIKQVLREAP